jgi:pimeloyl-ACP methyl ester carboxylesterase
VRDEFTVTMFDNRGSGLSDHYSIQQMSDDAAALIEHLGLAPAHVFGISMGGMIAQELAIRHGALIDRLVLGCTHCGCARVIPPSDEVNRAFAYAEDDWSERMRLLAPWAFSEKTRRERPQDIQAFIVEKQREVQPLFAYRRQLGAAVRHDCFDRLPQIQRPTLVITGAADDVIPAENSDVLQRAIPDAQLCVIPDAGHLFFLEQPDQVAGELRAFLNASG